MITVMNRLILFLFTLVVISCGKSVQEEDEPKVPEEVNIDGTYTTFLLPTNNNIAPNVSGSVKVSKYGDDFRVEVKLKDSPGGVHRQYLQTGTSCKAFGSKILPLDDDLSGQSRGRGYFPSGNYHYKRSTSYYLMLSDLHLPDDDYSDEVVKLETWDLPLEKKAVVIYARRDGVDVAMACGLLTRTGTTETGDNWREPEPSPPRRPAPDRVEPRPRPRPRPEPTPRPAPEVSQPDTNDDNNSGTWWERMRQRWRRWRDRVTGRDPDPRLHTT